jgi:hypothetical protein
MRCRLITPNKPPTGRDAAVAVVALMQHTVDRLPPLTIVNLFDTNIGRGQIETMWNKLADPTAACMQDGAKTLARIWEAAWRAGSGEHWPAAGKFTEGQFAALYNNKTFLPSYTLQDVTLDGHDHIVPLTGGRSGTTDTHPTRRSNKILSPRRRTAGTARRRSGGQP